ncbi:MAG: hypothetical protein ACREBW_00355, partial [Candidatus Micrarchaeaceae archaeon]
MLKFLMIVAFLWATPAFAQGVAIRWMRAPAPIGNFDIIYSLNASARSVYATSNSAWYFYSLGTGISLEQRDVGESDTGTLLSAFCGVLDRGDSELLTGGTGIVSWLPASNRFTQIYNPPSSGMLWIDATKDGNLIASSDGNTLHLYDRMLGKDIKTWANSDGPVSFSPDGKLLLAALSGSLALIDV